MGDEDRLTPKEAIALIRERQARLAAEAETEPEQDELSNDPWATAIHEAGHAVVAEVLGLRPQSVTARSDHDSAGHTRIEDPYIIQGWLDEDGKWREFDTIMRGRILAMMAGCEAEEECLGFCEGGDGEDRYQIALMLDVLPGADTKEARMRRFARTLVRRHRAAIERVAHALMDLDELDAEGIARLVQGCAQASAT